MTRNRTLALVTSLLLTGTLVACSGTSEPEPQGTTSPEPTSQEPQEQTPAEEGTLASFLSNRYLHYDSLNQAIADGSGIPSMMRLYVEGTTDAFTRDPEVIARTWRSLTQLRIDQNNRLRDADSLEGPHISFSFVFDDGIISIPFNTTAYTDFTNTEVFPVEKPEEVQALVDELTPIVEAERPQPGDTLEADLGTYLWDANGDGLLDELTLELDQEEDLYGIVAKVYSENNGGLLDAEAYLYGAYKVISVELDEDEQGSLVYVTYNTDKDGSPGHEKRCALRLSGNELEIIPVEHGTTGPDIA